MLSETILALIPMCSPNVAPNTIAQIIRVESGGNPLALNVNGINKKFKPQNTKEAANLVRKYVELGHSVDMGLMQINSTNISWLGYELDNVEKLFEPCNNLAAGAKVLTAFYNNSKTVYKNDADALRGAISAYNTGDLKKGITNGYVGKVYGSDSTTNASNTNSILRQALNSPTTVNIDVLLKNKNNSL